MSGEKIADANVLFGRGVVDWREGPKEAGGSNVSELRVKLPNGREGGETVVKVNAWGRHADAAGSFKKGDRVQFAGRMRHREWPEDDPRNEVIEIVVSEKDPEHMVAKADAEDDINQANLEGEVLWASDVEEIGEKKTKKRRLLVGCRHTNDDGEVKKPSHRVEIFGKGAESAVTRGDLVAMKGLVENRVVPGEGGNRYFAALKIAAEGHAFEVRAGK